MKWLFVFFLLIYSFSSKAQHVETTRAAIDELKEFIAIPNFGLNEKDIDLNLNWLTERFTARGFKTQQIGTSGNPLLFAEMVIDRDFPTVLFYMHLDGQAVDPSKWDQANPYIAVIKKKDKDAWIPVSDSELSQIDEEWRIFGRSASDDKGPIIAFLHAIDIIKSKSITPHFNIKVILDAEEELGSKPLAAAVKKNRDLLLADALVINDGPTHLSGHPTLNFGCRGIMTVNMTVYGPVKPQHSGHYGNYAPNPIFSLSHLLSSMKDKSGKVTIDGFYDGIPMNKEVEEILKAVPDDEAVIRKGLVINKPDAVGKYYQQALQYPSLNVRHIETSWKGPGLKTVIPEVITAYLDVRLVAETDGAAQIEKIKKHIVNQGYYLIDQEPTDEERLKYPNIVKFRGHAGVNAFRTEVNSKIGQKLSIAIEKAFGEKPVSIRTMGGTVPIIPAINTLKIPAIIVPMVNMDNNQHNPNENIRIGNIETGIKICMAILTMKL